jgi:hypothetical protein
MRRMTVRLVPSAKRAWTTTRAVPRLSLIRTPLRPTRREATRRPPIVTRWLTSRPWREPRWMTTDRAAHRRPRLRVPGRGAELPAAANAPGEASGSSMLERAVALRSSW